MIHTAKRAGKFGHVQLPIQVLERVKRLSSTSNRTIAACIDVVTGHWEKQMIARMNDEERKRYLAGDMSYDEVANIYQREQKPDFSAALEAAVA
jgi:hypothetical protein